MANTNKNNDWKTLFLRKQAQKRVLIVQYPEQPAQYFPKLKILMARDRRGPTSEAFTRATLPTYVLTRFERPCEVVFDRKYELSPGSI